MTPFSIFIDMKKVIRLSESDLVILVKKVIDEAHKPFYLRRSEIINNYVDEAISDIIVGGFEPEDFEDYKSEVLWKTLGSLEYDNEREVDDVEEFFKYVKNKVINNKIKQGYLEYKKMNPSH